MPVPKYDELMLPYLQYLSDGDEHKHTKVTEALADYFNLSVDDRRQMLPSGRQTVLVNRSSWARTYLRKAGLIEKTQRGWHRITTIGLEVLEEEPPAIDRHYLMRFPTFVAFANRAGSSKNDQAEPDGTADETPEELIESSYQSLRQSIAKDLLERIMDNSPQFFELLVVDLMLAMGYGGSRRDAGQAVGRSRDGGIDGIIKEDRLGLNNIYIQAKRWENTVGRPEVQTFSGALDMHRASRGVFITTSSFSTDARDFVNRIGKRIVLIDGWELAELMIDHGVGITIKATYAIHEIDENYFDDE